MKQQLHWRARCPVYVLVRATPFHPVMLVADHCEDMAGALNLCRTLENAGLHAVPHEGPLTDRDLGPALLRSMVVVGFIVTVILAIAVGVVLALHFGGGHG